MKKRNVILVSPSINVVAKPIHDKYKRMIDSIELRDDVQMNWRIKLRIIAFKTLSLKFQLNPVFATCCMLPSMITTITKFLLSFGVFICGLGVAWEKNDCKNYKR